MRFNNQKGSIAVEEVMISALFVVTLGGTFAALSTNIDSGIQRSQGVYSSSHIQAENGDGRPAFGLVSMSNDGATVVPEVPEDESYAPDGLEGPSSADFKSLVDNSKPAMEEDGVTDREIFQENPKFPMSDEEEQTEDEYVQ